MVLDRWLPILTPIESSVELVRLFKEKGLGLYVISNFTGPPSTTSGPGTLG